MTPLDLAGWAQTAVAGVMPLALPGRPARRPGLLLHPLRGAAAARLPRLRHRHERRRHHQRRHPPRPRRRRHRPVRRSASPPSSSPPGCCSAPSAPALVAYQTVITRVVGVLAIVMGLIFAGLVPLGRRELRLQPPPGRRARRRPAARHRLRARLDPLPRPHPQRRHLPRPQRGQRRPRRPARLHLRPRSRHPVPGRRRRVQPDGPHRHLFPPPPAPAASDRRPDHGRRRPLLLTGGWDYFTGALRQWAAQFTTVI